MDGIIISTKENTKEIKLLAESLGYKIRKEFIQRREYLTSFYIGKGKLEEAKRYVKENGIAIAFVNDALRPSQWFNLEKFLGINVYDRIRLILEIFTDRAKRKEAKLQVKLAKLRYEKPFVRELFHRLKEGERPGFLAGGEYVVADYYEMMKKQMKKIKEELKKIEKERDLKRAERKEKGFYLISLAGYTNAGKSSLLNALTESKVLVEKRVFSTLSTKTSKIKKSKSSIPLLLTDTVGFIKDLPHWLIDAFHSTLEEISLADLVILLVDASESIDEMKEKALASIKEIYSLKEKPNIIVALNKIDLIGKKEIEHKKREMEKFVELKCIPISTKTGEGLNNLLDTIYDSLPKLYDIEITLPKAKINSFISWLYENAEISDFHFDGIAKLKIRCSERIKDKIIGRCKKMGGFVHGY